MYSRSITESLWAVQGRQGPAEASEIIQTPSSGKAPRVEKRTVLKEKARQRERDRPAQALCAVISEDVWATTLSDCFGFQQHHRPLDRVLVFTAHQALPERSLTHYPASFSCRKKVAFPADRSRAWRC